MSNNIKTILLFNVKHWNVLMVKDYLIKLGKYELRFGFSYIVAIFDELDKQVLPDPKEEILYIKYDKKSESAKNDILVIRKQSRNTQSLSYIASKPNKIIF